MGEFLDMVGRAASGVGEAPAATATGAFAPIVRAGDSGGTLEIHRSEVDLGLRNFVHVVGQRVERNVNHDLHHFRVTVAGVLHGTHGRIGDMSAFEGDARGKAHRRIRLGVVRSANPVGGDFCVVQLRDVPAEVRMGSEAVAAGVDLGDGERDTLAGLRT
jgi:hypothetical protein